MSGAPIDHIEGTRVVFEKSLGANISEQFLMKEIEGFAAAAGLKVTDSQKVGDLAYICTLVKV